MKTILTIAGSDSCGGAGIQADTKTFTEFGVCTTSAITAVTSQNTSAILAIHPVPSHAIATQIDAVATNTSLDAVKIGMLGTADAVKVVAEKIQTYRMPYVVLDPIITSSSGISLLSDTALLSLKKKLLPLSFLITPNISEAERLTNRKIKNIKEMKQAAQALYHLGPKNVLITGGHLSGDAVDILYDGTKWHTFTTERLPIDMHGTGCIFSAAITAGLTKGKTLPDAIKRAKNYITAILKTSLPPKKPIGAYQVDSIGKRHTIIAKLQNAIDALHQLNIGTLTPEVQANIAYALPNAQCLGDVAAIPGRLIRLNLATQTISPPMFGCSTHIGKIVLTAMKYDHRKRAAMNIKYSKKILSVCRRLNLNIAGFDRTKEPQKGREKEGTTLEWGTEHTIKRKKYVPDIIYDKGDIGKEPMIRIIADTPLQLVHIVKKIKKTV